MLGSWTFNRIAWSLRKASLPIKPSDLVLDVGSGSNPHPAADVLLERYLDPKHRYGPMLIDRPTVLADACKMPFADKTFDFAIAFHVLEHVPNPEALLNELQRVSKAGYIETPNALFERLVPYDVHLLEIMNIDETLIIHKKSSAKPDRFLNELDLIKRSAKWNRLFYGNPKLFHVRYFWKDIINFKIINPEISSEWFVEPKASEPHDKVFETNGHQSDLRSKGLAALRSWHKFRKKSRVDLVRLLVCPDCHGSLVIVADLAICERCQLPYSMQPVPDFNQPAKCVTKTDSRQRAAKC